MTRNCELKAFFFAGSESFSWFDWILIAIIVFWMFVVPGILVVLLVARKFELIDW
jgi:hypothetical protein